MGEPHVALQTHLMPQSLRKLANPRVSVAIEVSRPGTQDQNATHLHAQTPCVNCLGGLNTLTCVVALAPD